MWRSQMSQISKCPNVTVVLTYWEPSGEISELRYKSLLYFSFKWSYCSYVRALSACSQKVYLMPCLWILTIFGFNLLSHPSCCKTVEKEEPSSFASTVRQIVEEEARKIKYCPLANRAFVTGELPFSLSVCATRTALNTSPLWAQIAYFARTPPDQTLPCTILQLLF